jgi:hypothetical protein
MTILAVIHGEGAFTPEDAGILISAFECTLKEAGLVNREDPLTLMIAKQIIAIARDGERDPQKLSSSTLAALGLRRNVEAA